jgi:hypothetical protein
MSCKERNGWGGEVWFGRGVDRTEKLWEVADVRRGVDGCWREDKIYGTHTCWAGTSGTITASATPATLQVKA